MAEGWRYFATRLNGDGTETFLDSDVPLTDVSIEEALSGPGGLSGKISPEYARLKAPDGSPLFREWQTAIYAETDGQIRGAGILTHSSFNGSSWDLEATGFTGYAKDMPWTAGGIFYVLTDTLDIFRAIWAHIQGQDGGNIGLVFDQRDSGKAVGTALTVQQYDPAGAGDGGLTLESTAFKLRQTDNLDLSSDLDNLATITPFDYRERHYWEGVTIKHVVEFGLPAFGRRRPDLRFTVGENVMVYPEVTRDGETFANEVYVFGKGTGPTQKKGYAKGARDRLRRPVTIVDSTKRFDYTSRAYAEKELQIRQRIDDFTSIVVRDSPSAPIGSVDIGDEIFIGGDLGWLEINTWVRVTGKTISPDAPNAMTLDVLRADKFVTPAGSITPQS